MLGNITRLNLPQQCCRHAQFSHLLRPQTVHQQRQQPGRLWTAHTSTASMGTQCYLRACNKNISRGCWAKPESLSKDETIATIKSIETRISQNTSNEDIIPSGAFERACFQHLRQHVAVQTQPVGAETLCCSSSSSDCGSTVGGLSQHAGQRVVIVLEGGAAAGGR